LGIAFDFVLVSAGLIGLAFALSVLRPSLVVTYPRTTLAILAAVSLGAAAELLSIDPPGLSIQLDPSTEPLLPSGDAGQEVYREAVLDFGTDDIYVIVMESDDVFTHENLTALRRVTDRIRRLPNVRGAESLVEVPAFRYLAEEDWVEVGNLIDEIPTGPEELAALRERALSDPVYPKVIVSPDGRAAAVNVTFQPMTDGEFVKLDLDGRILSILEEETSSSRRFFVSGRPHVRSEAHHLMVHDMLLLIPLAIVIAALAVWLMTGSVRGTFIPLTNCLTATLWAFGAMALIGKDMNVITLILGPMMICVGSVYGVHVVARYEELEIDAPDPQSAAFQTLEYTRLPVLIAGFTTCVGFGALLLADVTATNELGGFSVLGIAGVTFLSLTGVPAVLALLPLERGHGHTGPLYAYRTPLSAWAGRAIDSGLEALGRLDTRRPGSLLVGWGLLAVLAVVLIPRIVIDTDYLTFFDPDTRVRTDFAQVNRLVAGAVPIYVVFQSDKEGTFRSPETLRLLESLQNQIEKVPGVSRVLSAVDLVKVANRALQGGGGENERIPDTRGGVAEAIFTIPKEKLRRFATSNHSSANLVIRTGELGSAAIRKLEQRVRVIVDRADLPAGIRTEVTGNAIRINRSADGIAGNQINQVGFAAVTIFILVCIAFRSVRVGLLSMVPNIVPVLIFFGVLGAGVATLSIATSLIGSIALGIAIDDTVHFLVAYHRERVRFSPEESIVRCVRTVGRPIVMTSVMLVVGFLVLLVSGFVTLREFGYLTAMTMAICLSTDLTLLPALLVRLRA
jgi:hydrophobe/amphiphile efflux-3 (HAE3) family protein